MAPVLGNLRKPVRNLPSASDRHKCSLIVTVDADGNELAQPVDLHDEVACRQNSLENGMVFTCTDTVTVGGVEQACGIEWVLHYPTTFAWKRRRAVAEANGAAAETATETPSETPVEEPATERKRGKH